MIIEEETKRKTKVIFVCTGNTCRSPMAEFMFKDYLRAKKRSGDFVISSAGLVAQRGDTLNPTADKALDVLGIKHNKDRKARVFTVQMSQENDLIIAMTESHAERCGNGDNVVSFEQLIGTFVGDPYGGSLADYLDCAALMRSAFDRILALCDGLKSNGAR